MDSFCFKRVEIGDRDVLNEYLTKAASISCEYSFANLYAWLDIEEIGFCIKNDVLLLKNKKGYFFPIGGTLAAAAQIADSGGSFVNLTGERAEELSSAFPGRFDFECDRNRSEYIYDAGALREYSGKKLHSKRNHMNRFTAAYGAQCTVERICAGNIPSSPPIPSSPTPAMNWTPSAGNAKPSYVGPVS